MIARDHNHTYASVTCRADRLRNFRARRIPKQYQPEEPQIFVTLAFTPREAQHPESFCRICRRFFFPTVPVLCSQSTSGKQNFRRTFQITDCLSVVLDSDAHELMCAVERNPTVPTIGL